MSKKMRSSNGVMFLSLGVFLALSPFLAAGQPPPDLKERIESELAGDPLLIKENIKLKLASETFGDVVLYMVSGNHKVRESISKGADVLDPGFASSFGLDQKAEDAAKTIVRAVAGIYALDGVKQVRVKAMVNTLCDKGSEAYDRKDYSKAIEYYTKAAGQEDAVVLYRLGFMYRNGLGTTRDNARAALFFGKAAELGYAAAQCNLGYLYNNGLGVEKDHARAFELYSKAAGQGYDIAQNNLGRMYEKGFGTARDYAMAVAWYTKSFEQGYALAGCNLGKMYEKGLGVTRDYAKAVDCFNMAIFSGEHSGTINLAWLYATAADPAYRNGKKAVELAESVVSQKENKGEKLTPGILRTIAAAYARDGQFNRAVETQEKCLTLLNAKTGKPEGTKSMTETEENPEDEQIRMNLYKANTAYTDEE